jgi:hypothetical protein
MRANPTTRVTHECEIVDGQGLRVLPRALPVTIRPFAAYQALISRSPTRYTPGTRGETDESA